MGAYDFVSGDAIAANSFKVTIGGEPIHVKEVSGLKMELDMVEVKTQNPQGHYL
jgi:hypothetical protein